MTKDEYWKAIVKRNPLLAEDDKQIKQTVSGLRRLVEQAYDRGHEQGFRNGEAAASMKQPKGSNNPFTGMFDGAWK